MTTLFNYNLSKHTGTMFIKEIQKIRKFARSSKGLKLLINEYQGFEWYKKQIINKLKSPIKNCEFDLNKNYIDFNLILGKQLNYWDSISSNFIYAQKVTEDYKLIWPKSKFVPCHGDLTLSNVIFRENKHPFIIDWENFYKKESWGYDVCYFLISCLVMPSIVFKKKISVNEFILFEKLWKNFYRKNFFPYSSDPINYLKKRFKIIFKNRKYEDFFPNKISKKLGSQISEITKI